MAVWHSLIAASTAFAPVGPQKCTRIRSRIAGGSMSSCSWMNWSFAGVGRSSPCTKVRSWASTAATTGSGEWPSDRTPAPLRKSRKTLPSTSSM